MGVFDLILAGIFVVSILVGVMRGFIREALSIASWILAIWLGITFCQPAGEFIAGYFSIPADGFRSAAGFALVFIGTLFGFSIISFGISKLIVKGVIKGTDRILGIGFGVVRAAAIVVAVLLVGRGMGMENSGWWQNSKYLGYFEPMANYVEIMLPSNLQSSGEIEGEIPVDQINQDSDAATGIEHTQ
jgi:membrane protein required for colicin V production